MVKFAEHVSRRPKRDMGAANLRSVHLGVYKSDERRVVSRFMHTANTCVGQQQKQRVGILCTPPYICKYDPTLHVEDGLVGGKVATQEHKQDINYLLT
jgi:hypothetical protein